MAPTNQMNIAHLLFSIVLLLFFSRDATVMGARPHGEPYHVLPARVDSSAQSLQTFIVHVKTPENLLLTGPNDLEKYYKSFLPTTTAGFGESRLVYAYGTVMSGFAAMLTEGEVKDMEKMEGFVQAYPDRILPILTTHTPDFLGLQLENGFWKDSKFGKGVVVGVLDTGFTPGHPSFNDDGMPPPPSKWKGSCDSVDFCNNKVIGARSFIRGEASITPIDKEGHGTHTASTAAGALVKNAEALGNANGTAVGMAPGAHLAIYKVCSLQGCATSDILGGMDTAVKDGVDVMSLSLGGASVPFYNDGVAIGAFGAVEKGVFVSCAGGNSGPSDSTLSNEAPWILTVGASTMDRAIRTTLRLDDGQEFDGESLFQPHDFSSTMLPVLFPGTTDRPKASFCAEGSLDGIDVDVKGAIVMCKLGGDVARVAKGEVVKAAGGAGMVLMNTDANGYTTLAEAHVLPTVHVSFADASKIESNFVSSTNTTASIIFKGTIVGTSPSPVVAFFSSRGPSKASPGILKPDITGPGVNVLAAWPSQVGELRTGSSSASTFNVISGTSMSTPHLSGIAALLKSAHPDWSPAAIKSAIMTTSDILDHDGKPIRDEKHRPASFFAMGAGHVNPSKASDPGLVYDLGTEDYTSYLCGLGYTDAQVESITRRSIKCSEIDSFPESELNYPSISVSLQTNSEVTVNRTVTNVGEEDSSYSVEVDQPEGVLVNVKPKKLQFSKMNEKKLFSVTFSSKSSLDSKALQGNLRWVSDKHVVRSPISVSFD